MPSKTALISATVTPDGSFYHLVKSGLKNESKGKLVIHADMWRGTLEYEGPEGLGSFKSLDACRAFATKHGYKGIWIHFGIIKYQVSVMIRKFRHQDKTLLKAGLSRKEVAGVRAAQRRREKELTSLAQ